MFSLSRFMPTVRRLWPVLKKAGPVVVCVGGIGAAWGVGSAAASDTSDAIRYAGTLLQFFGIVLVAYGLHDLRKSFGQPPVLSKIREWFRELRAALKPRQYTMITGTANITLGGLTSDAFAHVTGGTVEQRLSRTEEELIRLREQLRQYDTRLTKELTDVRTALADEAHERRTVDERVHIKLDELAVGGLHLEMVGLVWLLLATVASSIPDEIALWLS